MVRVGNDDNLGRRKVNAFARSSRSNSGAHLSGDEARNSNLRRSAQIVKIGTWFSSAEETLLNLGLPPNRKGGQRGFNRRSGFPQ